MATESGRVGSAETGSKATPEARSGLRPTGYDPARVAAALTNEQRAAVLALGSTPSRLGLPRGIVQRRISAIRWCPYPLFLKTPAADCRRYHLSALGLAVRAQLESAA